jgi:hypothetical protein
VLGRGASLPRERPSASCCSPCSRELGRTA